MVNSRPASRHVTRRAHDGYNYLLVPIKVMYTLYTVYSKSSLKRTTVDIPRRPAGYSCITCRLARLVANASHEALIGATEHRSKGDGLCRVCRPSKRHLRACSWPYSSRCRTKILPSRGKASSPRARRARPCILNNSRR